MTDWTEIANGDVQQGQPVTQQLMTALRDNPAAIAEGADGAPEVNFQALGKFTAGSVTRYNDDAQYMLPENTGWTEVFSVRPWGSGVARLVYSIRSNSSGGASGRILINGVQVQIATATGSYVQYTFDATLALGDVVSVEHQSNGPGVQSYIRDILVQTNGEQFIPFSTQSPEWIFT